MSSDNGSGNVVKVDDEYLQGVILTQINSFLTDIQGNSAVTAIQDFANFTTGGSPQDGVSGQYYALMPGSPPLTEAATLQAKFQSLCSQLQTELNTLSTQMTNMSVDLQTAQTILQNANDETLTAAQMMQVLNNVYQDTGSLGGTSTTSPNTNPNTNPNSNPNSNPNPNVNT
jgi:hypothetical protein